MPNPKVEKFNMIWRETPEEKRKELIKTLEFDDGFSVCNSLQEIASRGGGWLARDLLNLYLKSGLEVVQ